MTRPLLAAALLAGCVAPAPTPEPTPQAPPYLLARPGDRERVLARLDEAPFDALLDQLIDSASRTWTDGDRWEHAVEGRKGEIAQDAAFLGWLLDDPGWTEVGRAALSALRDDFDTQQTWDVNIRMPAVLLCGALAWDLLAAGDFPEAEATRQTLLSVTSDFYDGYVEEETMRRLLLLPAQNNHPIRTAAAIGAVALAFPDAPEVEAMRDWSFSELDALWGPEGRYVQPDGGVSEGPFYFGFAFAPSVALFRALDNATAAGRGLPALRRDCRTRSELDPWFAACTPGEPFTFDNPLHDPAFAATATWSVALRLPWGSRPPLADAYFNGFNGGVLLPDEAPFRRWDWETNRDQPFFSTHGQDLLARHLLDVPDVDPAPPPWTSVVLPDAGQAVFRSSWAQDAVWGMLVGESGAARKTLHDHVDGTSFTLAAFGEYLLIDPGYYKPVDYDNARTAHSPSHNVVLVDGLSAPDKGLLTDFGDADATLTDGLLGGTFEVATATQTALERTATRTAIFVDGRYFVLVDRARSDAGPREHRFRLHGYGGGDTGGGFTLTDDGATWSRLSASVAAHVGSPDGPLRFEEPPWEDGRAPHVHEFELDRSVGHHAVMDAVIDAEAPSFLSVLMPYPTGPAPTVTSVAGPGVGWRIEVDGQVDHALMGPGTWTVDGVTVTTDADAVVLRGGAFVAVGGGSLTLDGVTVATWTDPVFRGP